MKTLATAFKEVYGEALKEYGFKKIKGKYPYYVRVIGDEIVHVITYKEEWCAGQNLKAFSVLGGVATVYRGVIDLEKSPKDNTSWLIGNANIYGRKHPFDADEEYIKKISKFEYEVKNEESMLNAINYSLQETKKNLFDELNIVNNLKKCIEYYFKHRASLLKIYLDDNFGKRMGEYEENEGLLSVIIYGMEGYDEFVKEKWDSHNRFEKLEEHWIKIGKSGLTMEEHEKWKHDREQRMLEQIKIFELAVKEPMWKEKIKTELEQRKQNNLEILKNCGLM